MAAPRTLSDFLAQHHGALTAEVLRRFPPHYAFSAGDSYAQAAAGLRRRLFPAQFHVAAALTDYLRDANAAALVGEPSVGKTITALAVSAFLGAARVLVVAPAHLLAKWQREIVGTIPGARCVELERISDLAPAIGRYAASTWPLFCLLSRDRAKLGAPWRVAVRPSYLLKPARNAAPGTLPHPVPFVERARALSGLLRDDAGEPVVGYRCHDCGRLLADVPTDEELEKGAEPELWTEERLRERGACRNCGGALWTSLPLRSGRGMYPIARYLAQRFPNAFDLLVIDEVHSHKARGSASGMALADLTRAAKRTLALTGTLMSGRASSLFYLLHRLSPSFRRSWTYGEAGRFTRTFGLAETSTEPFEEVTVSKSGKQTRRQLTRTTTRELPGVSPAILGSVLDRAAFMHLSDLGIQLPPYREHALEVALAAAQAEPYRQFFADLRGAIAAGYHRRNLRLLGGYLQALLSWPDAPWRGDTLSDPSSGEVVAAIAALDSEVVYPKEQALIELCRREQAAGRRVLVYCTHTKRRDITARLHELLTGAGLRAAVLTTAVGPHGREAWIRRRVGALDALVTSPRLVGEGLDLIEFPTVVWMEPEYSTYIVRQASRRTWRLTQREPVDVHFMIYADTLQQQALSLVARGIRAASMVDGEVLPEETLASDYGSAEFFLSLAKMVVDRTAVKDLGAALLDATTRAASDAGFLGGATALTLPTLEAPAPVVIRDRQIAVTRADQIPLF